MSVLATNKRAYFDYEILETFEAGIELLGHEVKAIKTGHVNLVGSYGIIRGNEVWLLHADIPPYQAANTPAGYDQKRNRKLLLHKEEIKHLTGKINERGLTLLALRVYTKGRRNVVKLELGLGKGKKKADKRETIKKREAEREMQRET